MDRAGGSGAAARAPGPTRGRAWRRFQNAATPYLFLLPTIAGLCVVYFYPMLRGLDLTFQSFDPFKGFSYVGVANYLQLLRDAEFHAGLVHSLVWVVGSVAGQFAVGFGVALLLNVGFPGNRLVRTLIVVPWVLPGVVTGLSWKLMYDPTFGLFNDILRRLHLPPQIWLSQPGPAMVAIIVPNIWKAFPFVTVTMLAGLASISQDFYEAAQVEGASAWQQFLNVTMPSLRNLIAVTTLLLVVWTFNYFDLPFIITGGGPARATETVPLLVYRHAFENFRFGLSAALAVLMTAINLIFAVFYLRSLRRID